MRKPIRASSAGVLTPLIYQLLLCRESLVINVKKIPARMVRIPVDTDDAETWRNYIME